MRVLPSHFLDFFNKGHLRLPALTCSNALSTALAQAEKKRAMGLELSFCCDTDQGATDKTKDGCAKYNKSWCGLFDKHDFMSKEMCCTCGGGTKGLSEPCDPLVPSATHGRYIWHAFVL